MVFTYVLGFPFCFVVGDDGDVFYNEMENKFWPLLVTTPP